MHGELPGALCKPIPSAGVLGVLGGIPQSDHVNQRLSINRRLAVNQSASAAECQHNVGEIGNRDMWCPGTSHCQLICQVEIYCIPTSRHASLIDTLVGGRSGFRLGSCWLTSYASCPETCRMNDFDSLTGSFGTYLVRFCDPLNR